MARNSVWRAACKELDEAGQKPDSARGQLQPPTASALLLLALAVDLVRRGSYVEANDLLPQVRQELLRLEETHLLWPCGR